ncbi:hypothetical protein MASR2M64_18050 [Candidatus Cloacimonadota bacterium]
MRFCLLVLTVLSAVIMMTGCAVMDLSTLETAMPIAPARVQASGYVATGLDLATAVYSQQAYYGLPTNSHEDGTIFSGLAGLKIGVSVSPKADLIARYYKTGHGLDIDDLFVNSSSLHYRDRTTGMKLGGKALIYQENKNYVAVMPLYTRVRGVSTDYWTDDQGAILDDYEYRNLYNSDGIELQIIYTYKAGKVVQFSLAGKYNYNYYREVYHNVQSKAYHLNHYGIRGNVCVTGKHVFLFFELGEEFVPIHPGFTKAQPNIGWGLGLKL